MSKILKGALAGAMALTALGLASTQASAQPFGPHGYGGPGRWHHGPGPWRWHHRPHGPWGWHHRGGPDGWRRHHWRGGY